MEKTIKISTGKNWDAFLENALKTVVDQLNLSINLFGGLGPDLKPEFTEQVQKYFGCNFDQKKALVQLKSEYENFLNSSDGEIRVDWFEDSKLSNDEWYGDKECLLLTLFESVLMTLAIKKLMKNSQTHP